nr:hypothetical protein [uncultured Cohaesibacter sp.]
MVNLPNWPPYCRDLMAKAILEKGEPVWATQRRWEILREHENKRIQWCADHYAKIQKDYGGKRK